MEAAQEAAPEKVKKFRRGKGHKSRITANRTKATLDAKKESDAVPKGKKRKASTVRQDKIQVAKREEKAKTRATIKKMMDTLKPVAKEINVKFKLAAQLDGKADDHRLSAALLLESARHQCKGAKIVFAIWCKKNVDKSYDEVRKLVAIAAAPEPAKALADMRASAAARNRHLRKRQRDEKVSRDTDLASRSETPWAAADALVASLPDSEALTLIESRAGHLGMSVVSETDKNLLKHIDETTPGPVGPDEIYNLFLGLKGVDQLRLVREMAEHIGGTFTYEADEDDPAIPESMRRKK